MSHVIESLSTQIKVEDLQQHGALITVTPERIEISLGIQDRDEIPNTVGETVIFVEQNPGTNSAASNSETVVDVLAEVNGFLESEYSLECREEKTSKSLPKEELGAFGEQIMQYSEGLFYKALRYTGNKQEAEDLLQTTFLNALRFSATFQPGTNLKGWLYKILDSKAISRYRHINVSPQTDPFPDYPLDEVDIYLAKNVSSKSALLDSPAEEEALERLSFMEIQEALNSIGRNQRNVIELVDINGLSYQEAAEKLNINIGTVMSRLYRGRRQLAVILSDYAKSLGYDTTTKRKKS